MRSASTLGTDIIRCSNSVGVAISEALTTARRASISIEVTPTANRNTYSVARLVGLLPRVADFARNPGLGKRNSYRVAAADKLHNKRDQQRTPPQSSHERK